MLESDRALLVPSSSCCSCSGGFVGQNTFPFLAGLVPAFIFFRVHTQLFVTLALTICSVFFPVSFCVHVFLHIPDLGRDLGRRLGNILVGFIGFSGVRPWTCYLLHGRSRV